MLLCSRNFNQNLIPHWLSMDMNQIQLICALLHILPMLQPTSVAPSQPISVISSQPTSVVPSRPPDVVHSQPTTMVSSQPSKVFSSHAATGVSLGVVSFQQHDDVPAQSPKYSLFSVIHSLIYHKKGLYRYLEGFVYFLWCTKFSVLCLPNLLSCINLWTGLI